ncbi:MAG: 4-alpha-glucanotransferase [Clostridia bacterium]|nr:4-alpha-glucanotransferase [Clostridia bacterium]
MKPSLKNFGFKRKSGILMPISSLPSPYGIGSFGKGAYDFVDFLVETKTKCWQVLPQQTEYRMKEPRKISALVLCFYSFSHNVCNLIE